MLTFEALRKMAAEEKEAHRLTRLPDHFLEEATAYLEKKARIQSRKEDAWELESAQRLLQDLLDIRERKIVNLALYYTRSGVVPDHMTPEEERFFHRIAEVIAAYQQDRLSLVEKKEDKRPALAFLQDTPAFVGTDLQTYGPFKKGDVAAVPEPVGRLLIEKGMAKNADGSL